MNLGALATPAVANDMVKSLMPTGLQLTEARRTAEERVASAALFPGSLYGELSNMTEEGCRDFQQAIAAGDEENIQQALCNCPYLLQYVIPTSGHHGTWAFSRQMIRTKRADGTPGLIPDFLVATRSSLGFTWHIVELKKPSVQFGNADGTGYSTVGHKGIAQCATYAAHFQDYVETVRSNIGISELIMPKNVILVIGDSKLETESQKMCRSNFERIANNVVVATYDRIERGMANDRPAAARLGA